jgi:hypothetical protein
MNGGPRDWQNTQPPQGKLLEVWATDAQRVQQARWNGHEWHQSHWNGDAWTEDGGRVIVGVHCWRLVTK